jgi:hypothetical protein
MSTRSSVCTRCAPFVVLVTAIVASACGSSSIDVTAPTAPKCQVSATNSLTSAPADGANGTIAIDTTRDCTWTASSTAAWIALTSDTSGQGSGNLTYHVAANVDPTPRKAMIGVNDAQIVVSQDAGVCKFTIASANGPMSAAGGTLSLAVTASAAACAWTAASSVSWIETTTASGTGSGNAAFTVRQNSGDARSGVVTVAGQTVTVAQAAAGTAPTPTPTTPPPGPCTFTLDTTTQSVAAEGGTQHIGVNAPSGCTWTAASNAAWITVTGNAAGSGSAQVTYSAAPNTGAARSGTLTIAGVTLTVSQPSAACTFTLAPSSQSIAASGGNGSVSVTTRGDCSWNASSNANWLQISGGGSGSGNGTVNFTVGANGGAARSANVTVAGHTVTVSQGATPCAFSVTPATQAIASAGGAGSATIATTSGCAWTAASNANWITITSPASGTGGSTVSFTAAVNSTGASRSGTLTIAGQTITVTQDPPPAPCSFSIAPTSQSFADPGGTGSVTITTTPGCAWTAASNNADWLTLTTPASGTGNGTVGFSAAANTTSAPRTGTLTIAGQTFTVSEAAPPMQCTYAIVPASRMVDASGSFQHVNVTTGGSCAWTAVANADWLAVAPPASGTGSATVSVVVSRNPGPSRVGTVSIVDQTFTVMQAAADSGADDR